MDVLAIARRVLQIEGDAVLALQQKLNSSFIDAVNLIFEAKGRAIITGMGKSGLVGKKIAATLASTGTPSFFLHPAEAIHGDLGMVMTRDIVVAISNSGETDELTRLIPFLKRSGVRMIAMTGNAESTLATAADISLDISVVQEACCLGVTPTASTTAAMAMGDALAMALLERRGFKEEDFASFHPGGSLGKKLFVKVCDLMHRGDDLPFVLPDVTMSDLVMTISSKRLGMAIVAGSDHKPLGIVTDGDVRRGIQKYGKDLFDCPIDTVMTKTPKSIDGEELAAKALAVMQQHSITSIIVPDADGVIIGIVHLHDLLKKGIV